MLAALALAQAALAETASDPCWSLSDGDVVAALGTSLAVRSSSEALTASLVAQAETLGVRTLLGQLTTGGGCAGRSGSPRPSPGG